MPNELSNINTSLDLVIGSDLSKVTSQLKAIGDFQAVIQSNLKSGQDFGVIPGTNKPTLLKPGAEKIQMLFGVTSEYEEIERIQDYDKGFFAYTIKCTLSKNGVKITEGMGHCNTKEKKYITQDAYTLANTCLKMAKKRAQVDATLTIASLSDVFTQDIEDLQDFSNREQIETMNDNDATFMKVTFGKYKNQTLGEIAKSDKGYVEWLANNAKEEVLKKAAKLVLNPQGATNQNYSGENKATLITKEQEDEIMNLCGILGKVVGKSPDEVLIAYKAERLDEFATTTAADLIEKISSDLNNHMPEKASDNLPFSGTEIDISEEELPFT